MPVHPVAATGNGSCISTSPTGRLHDLTVFDANETALAGSYTTLFATIPNGSPAVSYTWVTGDGFSGGTKAGVAHHLYRSPGLYAVCVEAVDAWGIRHDDRASILWLPVSPSAATDPRGTAAWLRGSVDANGTATSGATPFVAAGGSVSVSVQVALPPLNPATRVGSVSFSATPNLPGNGTLTVLSTSSSGTSRAIVHFATTAVTGFYGINYTLVTTTFSNGTSLRTWSNYSFSIVVGAQLAGSPLPRSVSGHRGTLQVAEYASSTPGSFDPAFGTAGGSAELLTNVYQTLIAPNGTKVGGHPTVFVPTLATCVPDGSLCAGIYHHTLVTAGTYTFVLNNRSAFYDPATGASWGVWPTDVLFSFVRAMAFADASCYGCDGGWAVSETMLPGGSWTWDGGLHLPLNNTPSWIYSAVRLNETGKCPTAALAPGQHGCVTFHLPAVPYRPGSSRFFLELLANPLGASIEPCGWFSAPAQGAGIPYWTAGNVSGTGDRPCAPPGAPGAGVAPATLSPTSFDSWELNASMRPSSVGIARTAVGSGPYYVTNLSRSGYTLQASPSFGGDPYCTFGGCGPAPGSFPTAVNVSWLGSAAAVQSAVLRGAADVAVFPGNASGYLATDLLQGLLGLRLLPTLSGTVDPLNLDFNITAAIGIAGINLTAPSTVLADLNLRQFLIHAYPYDQSLAQFYAGGGLPTRGPGGGAIPALSGSFGPRNVSWPAGTPDGNLSDVGSAGWWWAQTSADLLAGLACAPVHPCSFLLTYPLNDSAALRTDRLWAANLATISNGSVVAYVHNESSAQILQDALYAGPGGQGPAITSDLTWGSDFVDPSDPVGALYLPDSTYTYSDAVAETLGSFNLTLCPTGASYWAALATPIPLLCQGAAYAAMVSAVRAGAVGGAGAAAVLEYAEAEQIANALGLYVYTGQPLTMLGIAPWLDPSSFAVTALATAGRGLAWDQVRFVAGPGSRLTLLGPAPSANPAAGLPLTLTALATGGAGGYVYNWSGLPSNCTGGTTASISCVPSANGTSIVHVLVVDAAGHRVSVVQSIVVGLPFRARRSGADAPFRRG